MGRILDEAEAFKAARYFIEQFNDREKSDALLLLINWMTAPPEEPTQTYDPAQWYDWVASVDRVVAERDA